MATNLKTEKLEIQVPGEKAPMPAYLAAPDAPGPHPAVVVFEEIFGVNSHIRDVTERLAREGYVAIAPDVHHRVAPGQELKYDQEGMSKGMPLIERLTQKGVLADLDAALSVLKSRQDVRADRIGAIGFCIGGHMAYLAAANRSDIKATASFYGGGIARFGLGGGEPTVTQSKNIQGRILCMFGKDDSMITADQVAAIRKALADAKTRSEVVEYDGATHGFFCDQRGSYNKTVAEDAWRRTKELFAAELKS
jgi:carboxymethylenebutenolidase